MIVNGTLKVFGTAWIIRIYLFTLFLRVEYVHGKIGELKKENFIIS